MSASNPALESGAAVRAFGIVSQALIAAGFVRQVFGEECRGAGDVRARGGFFEFGSQQADSRPNNSAQA